MEHPEGMSDADFARALLIGATLQQSERLNRTIVTAPAPFALGPEAGAPVALAGLIDQKTAQTIVIAELLRPKPNASDIEAVITRASTLLEYAHAANLTITPEIWIIVPFSQETAVQAACGGQPIKTYAYSD
jgi:hypothetical protein